MTQDWDDLQEYVRAGSDQAFTRLVGRHSGAVFAMCQRQLGDRHLSEDATQAVFLILAQRARKLGPRVVLSGWLFQTARYVCALAVAAPPPPIEAPLFAFEATVEGEIAAEPLGAFGFGYDPIFFFPPYGTTLANVSDERKLAVAHRGKAFRQLAAWLATRQ